MLFTRVIILKDRIVNSNCILNQVGDYLQLNDDYDRAINLSENFMRYEKI